MNIVSYEKNLRLLLQYLGKEVLTGSWRYCSRWRTSGAINRFFGGEQKFSHVDCYETDELTLKDMHTAYAVGESVQNDIDKYSVHANWRRNRFTEQDEKKPYHPYIATMEKMYLKDFLYVTEPLRWGGPREGEAYESPVYSASLYYEYKKRTAETSYKNKIELSANILMTFPGKGELGPKFIGGHSSETFHDPKTKKPNLEIIDPRMTHGTEDDLNARVLSGDDEYGGDPTLSPEELSSFAKERLKFT
jgi:hypothetical protein